MKNLAVIVALFVGILFTQEAVAQKVQTIKLEQTPGKFTQQDLTLKAGTPYLFEISNVGVDHGVGFVLAPKGKTEAENHITAAYVTEIVLDGASETSNEVVLEAGEYVYFCPLNPTEEYNLTVK